MEAAGFEENAALRCLHKMSIKLTAIVAVDEVNYVPNLVIKEVPALREANIF